MLVLSMDSKKEREVHVARCFLRDLCYVTSAWGTGVGTNQCGFLLFPCSSSKSVRRWKLYYISLPAIYTQHIKVFSLKKNKMMMMAVQEQPAVFWTGASGLPYRDRKGQLPARSRRNLERKWLTSRSPPFFVNSGHHLHNNKITFLWGTSVSIRPPISKYLNFMVGAHFLLPFFPMSCYYIELVKIWAAIWEA